MLGLFDTLTSCRTLSVVEMIPFTVGVVSLLVGVKMWYPDVVDTKLRGVRYI